MWRQPSAMPCSTRSCDKMEEFIVKDGRRLRLGYTTGSCAAAAAKAAAWMLLTGRPRETISLMTPKGIRLDLPVEAVTMEPEAVSCAIRKDGGDDPDITKGMLIFARVEPAEAGITIDGGPGIGRVTRRGLDQSVGSAAINSVPRRMIRENLLEAAAALDYSGGFRVTIYAPEGEALARKTFNPRLGILGGISILGTTGIVEPMSEQALVDTIEVELRQKQAQGERVVLLTPGNYGTDFARFHLGVDPGRGVQVSNFIGDALDLVNSMDFEGALLVGHIGKLVKLAGGMMNTHSKYGDCRMDLITAQAAALGLEPERAQALLECVTCDDALRILGEAGLREQTLQRLTDRITAQLQRRGGEQIGVILFSKEYGILGKSPNADALLERIREE